jgi:hypothetical protein
MPKPKSPTGKQTRTRRPFKKEFAAEIVATKLWAADDALFNEFVGRRRTTPAALLREIVHEWAMTIRVSGKAQDSLEMAGPIRKLHEQIIATHVAPVNEALSIILEQLSTEPAANTTLADRIERLVDDLTSTKEEVSRLKTILVPHYMLATQIFANTWAALQLIQSYLPDQQLTNGEASEEAEELRDSFRNEGLSMAVHLTNKYHPPNTFSFKLLAIATEKS